MRSRRFALIVCLLAPRGLTAQTPSSPPSTPGSWLLGLSPIQVIPIADLVNGGRMGLGTDFQLLKGFARRRLFVGAEVRFGGVGPTMEVIPKDNVPLALDQKDHAQNSLNAFTVPVRYLFPGGAFRPYVGGSVGMAIWGIKTWRKVSDESASLIPTRSQGHLEVSEGVGVIALARETSPSWYVDIGLRHASSTGVDYLKRSGFTSEGGKTVITLTPLNARTLIFSIGVTALFH